MQTFRSDLRKKSCKWAILEKPGTKARVRQSTGGTATFLERFELDNFPFDVQNLRICLKFVTFGGGADCTLWPGGGKFGKIEQKYSTMSEWKLQKAYFVFNESRTDGSTKNAYGRFRILFCLAIDHEIKDQSSEPNLKKSTSHILN